MHKDRHDGAATVLSGAGNGDQETLRMSRNVHGATCEGGPTCKHRREGVNMTSVQSLLNARKAPRLEQRHCRSHGLAFRLYLPLPSGKEYVKASGPLGYVMRDLAQSRWKG